MFRKLRGGSLVATAVAGLAVAASPAAATSTNLGSDFTPDVDCASQTTYFLGAPDATRVPGPGVITSWSFTAGPDPLTVRFKLGKLVATSQTDKTSEWTTVASTDIQQIEANAKATQEVRIPVSGGERLGFYLGADKMVSLICGGADGAGADSYAVADTAVGTTETFSDQTGYSIPLSAVLEPDADGDGYGDETQDLCPTDASHQDACPPARQVNGGPVQGSGAGRDRTAPVITSSKLSSAVFAVNTKTTASRTARGTRLGFNLSEAATVVFVTEQRINGKWRKVRIFGKRFGAGKNTLNYSGKIKPRGKQRALKPGRYRLRMRPSDRAGNKGVVSTVGFKIAK